jgi:SpoVK/Ycf46/Vps4 family AAA+-type ATPase
MGRIMDKYVGGSEGNMINAIRILEANSPCVLWVDEVEKALAGVQSSGFSDSGTFSRVFGILLTWLQERTCTVLLVATCNAMLSSNNQLMIPPEFQRKGRMDEIWWVDVPNKEETIEIIKIQLNKVNRDWNKFDLDMLSDISFLPPDGTGNHSYTGAEWESAVMDAMFDAYKENKREVISEDIAKSIKKSIPMSYFMRETLEKLREFGTERCRPASKYVEAKNIITAGKMSMNLSQVHI